MRTRTTLCLAAAFLVAAGCDDAGSSGPDWEALRAETGAEACVCTASLIRPWNNETPWQLSCGIDANRYEPGGAICTTVHCNVPNASTMEPKDGWARSGAMLGLDSLPTPDPCSVQPYYSDSTGAYTSPCGCVLLDEPLTHL